MPDKCAGGRGVWPALNSSPDIPNENKQTGSRWRLVSCLVFAEVGLVVVCLLTDPWVCLSVEQEEISEDLCS